MISQVGRRAGNLGQRIHQSARLQKSSTELVRIFETVYDDFLRLTAKRSAGKYNAVRIRRIAVGLGRAAQTLCEKLDEVLRPNYGLETQELLDAFDDLVFS